MTFDLDLRPSELFSYFSSISQLWEGWQGTAFVLLGHTV